LFTPAHQDDALDHVIVGLETELPQPRRVAHGHFADVADPYGSPIDAGDYNFADIFGVSHQPQPAYVVELPSLGIESPSGVGVVD
jgi:hypothetical protein